jgi:hypothetical protein
MGSLFRSPVLLVLALCGCGDGGASPDSAAQTIGSEGGTVALGPVTLVVPPGALDAPQTIRITDSHETPTGGAVAYTTVFRFTPDGLVFKLPASVRFAVPAEVTSAVVYWSNASGSYDPLESTSGAGVAGASIFHFSAGFAALPPVRDLGVPQDLGSEPPDLSASPQPDLSLGSDGGNCIPPGASCAQDPNNCCTATVCLNGICSIGL